MLERKDKEKGAAAAGDGRQKNLLVHGWVFAAQPVFRLRRPSLPLRRSRCCVSVARSRVLSPSGIVHVSAVAAGDGWRECGSAGPRAGEGGWGDGRLPRAAGGAGRAGRAAIWRPRRSSDARAAMGAAATSRRRAPMAALHRCAPLRDLPLLNSWQPLMICVGGRARCERPRPRPRPRPRSWARRTARSRPRGHVTPRPSLSPQPTCR